MQLIVTKEKPLEVDQEITHIRSIEKELQEYDHQQSNPSVVKEERENKNSMVDARGHLKKDAINEFYNKKFKKFLYYC